jgi:RND superfamily putative drug exporter
MGGLARWCIHHKNLVLFSWIMMLAVLGGVVGVAGSAFSDSTSLPASDSATAYSLLARAGSDAAKVTTGTIVWDTRTGSALSPAASSSIAPMLASVAKIEGVKAVISPFTAVGAKQVSADSRTAYATVVFTSDSHEAAAQELAKAAATSQLDVQVGGAAFTKISPGGVSEVIGILASLMILILVFRSAWAAVLPIITGVAGVGLSSLAVILLSHVITLPSVAPELGALIGLGVGFLTGLGVAAAVTVFLTVMAAVTLLPALLATMGRRVLRKSERAATGSLALAGSGPAPDAVPAGPGFWGRWARLVERRPVVAGVLAVAVLAGLAAPALAMRLGAADASSDPTGTSARSFYDTMADAFGKGFDAQVLLVAQTPDSQARTAWNTLTRQLPEVKGVASVGTPAAVPGNKLSTIQVVPTTASQDQATSDLVHTLRSGVVPRAEAGTGLRVYVGGTTATSIDFANALTSKLPLFLAIIAVLGFLLLTLAFRSLLVPAIGAIGNLLTIAVALGSTVALFQWGWGQPLFGIGGPAPLEYIVAILIVGVVFGLSMDYHVFLVSRMHERWTQTGDNRRAVTAGAADTGGVIVTAAAIMACVFASFGLAGVRTISEFGVGLAVAVLADAFLLRMTVIPAVMHLIGRRNWAIPSWLDRTLPHVSVESPGTNTVGKDRTPVPVEVP